LNNSGFFPVGIYQGALGLSSFTLGSFLISGFLADSGF